MILALHGMAVMNIINTLFSLSGLVRQPTREGALDFPKGRMVAQGLLDGADQNTSRRQRLYPLSNAADAVVHEAYLALDQRVHRLEGGIHRACANAMQKQLQLD
jgi:hypothetical protein